MKIEKMREQFEVWWVQQHFNQLFEDVKEQMFNVWVASRRDAAVEPPKIDISLSGGQTDAWCEGVLYASRKWRDAVEGAGVGVKA